MRFVKLDQARRPFVVTQSGEGLQAKPQIGVARAGKGHGVSEPYHAGLALTLDGAGCAGCERPRKAGVSGDLGKFSAGLHKFRPQAWTTVAVIDAGRAEDKKNQGFTTPIGKPSAIGKSLIFLCASKQFSQTMLAGHQCRTALVSPGPQSSCAPPQSGSRASGQDSQPVAELKGSGSTEMGLFVDR